MDEEINNSLCGLSRRSCACHWRKDTFQLIQLHSNHSRSQRVRKNAWVAFGADKKHAFHSSCFPFPMMLIRLSAAADAGFTGVTLIQMKWKSRWPCVSRVPTVRSLCSNRMAQVNEANARSIWFRICNKSGMLILFSKAKLSFCEFHHEAVSKTSAVFRPLSMFLAPETS
ncbi:hypothetical protein BDW74DRAFT_157470 [Aspergillus multicolor]|uniref:uncharacterized protein n=1 Tax=Aspergillus multicolor TaxID=41759 RepID=UPI003CCE2AA3